MRRYVTILGAMAVSLALIPPAVAADKVKVGFITKFPVDFFFTLENAAKKYAAAHPDVEVITGQGQSATDVEGQIALIESMIAKNVQGIAITPVDPSVAPALDKAVDAGIKVVLIDNDIPSWTRKTAVVATDNYKGGVLAGQWLRTKLKDGDKIGILEGVPGVPALDDRVKGMLDGLGDRKVVLVGKVTTKCTRELGVSGAEDILTANPGIAGIYAACGPPALGAIQSIENAKIAHDAILLVGFDALPEEVKEIIAGREDGSVAQYPAKMGELGVDTVVRAVRGETVTAKVDTGTAMVTRENAKDFK
jgi:ABC-type sugar transport system substrate-binding protein